MNVKVGEHRKSEMWLQPLNRNVQLVEVAVFLFLIVPSMGTSFFVRQLHLSFMVMALSAILNDLALMSLVLYLIWRNGESFHHIGWTFSNT